MDATFTIPLWADLLAIAVGSLQAAMFAATFRDQRLDLLGVAIVGIAVGLGGGLLRDIILGVPAFALSSSWPLIAATVPAFIGMLLERAFRRIDTVVTLFDAISIGLFAAIGTSKALVLGIEPVPAVFIGVISAVGGGLVRDVLLNLPIAFMHVGSFYALAAAGGSITYLTLHHLGAQPFVAGAACVVVTALLRMLAVKFGWSLPEQRALGPMSFPGKRALLARRRLKTVDADPELDEVTRPIEIIPEVGPEAS